MAELTINGRRIAENTRAYVIAEIGHNHEGDLRNAEHMLRCAAEAGASAGKLQKRHNRSLYTRSMYNEPYTGRNSYGPTYGRHREALEFGRAEYTRLAALAADLGIDFFATAFDEPSVDFLAELDVPAFKMASGDLTNTPLLAYAASVRKPMIVSTGAAALDDVRRAYETIMPINPRLALLQCTALYPAPPADLNLSVIATYRREFPGAVIGYSGHDVGPEMSLVAYSLGARVIEKHFTLDHSRPGSDHHFSLDPPELRRLVADLDDAHAALGSPRKRFLDREASALRKMGKKLVAARDLPAGHVLTEDDIAIKSPGDGVPPYRLPDFVGRALPIPVRADDGLEAALPVPDGAAGTTERIAS